MHIKNRPPAAPYHGPENLRLITPLEAAERLGLTKLAHDPRDAVLRLARRGKLRTVRVGKFKLIDPRSVDALLAGGFDPAAPLPSLRPKQYRKWRH